MDTPSLNRFKASPGTWVIIGAVLLLNVWYDYYDPRGIVLDVIIAVALLVAYLRKSR
jgi:hypothetical protein